MSSKYYCERRCSGALLALVLFTSVFGCHYSYTGDGTLEDRGMFVGADRYRIDLGEIATDRLQTREFSLKNLPSKRFTIGFDAGFLEKADRDLPTVGVELRDVTENRTILLFQKSLRDWVWSGFSHRGETFVYYWGNSSPSTNGKSQHNASGVVTGSTFIPAKWHEYLLRVSVVESSERAISLGLEMRGGGMKAPD